MNDAQIALLIVNLLDEQGLHCAKHNLRDDAEMFVSLLERKVRIEPTMLVLEVDGIKIGVTSRFTDGGITQAADFLMCKAYSFGVLRALILLNG